MPEDQKPEADETVDGPEVLAHTADEGEEEDPVTCVGYYHAN